MVLPISNIAPYRLSRTVPPSDTLPVCCIYILRRSPCLPYMQAIISEGKLLHDLEMMTTTANCSVPMPKRPSDKTGPSR